MFLGVKNFIPPNLIVTDIRSEAQKILDEPTEPEVRKAVGKRNWRSNAYFALKLTYWNPMSLTGNPFLGGWHEGNCLGLNFFKKSKLGGGFKCLLFSPRSLGKWSQLINIFQMGWNHQLELTSSHLKPWMVGRWWFPFGIWPIFRGQAVSFRGQIVSFRECICLPVTPQHPLGPPFRPWKSKPVGRDDFHCLFGGPVLFFRDQLGCFREGN